MVDRVMLHPDPPSEIKTLFHQLLDSPSSHLLAEENALAQGHALSRVTLYLVLINTRIESPGPLVPLGTTLKGHPSFRPPGDKDFLVSAS